MIGLIVYWDIHPDLVAVNGGAKRWLSSYLFSAEAFGVKVFVIGQPNIEHGYNMQHEEYANLNDLFAAHPDEQIVACVGAKPEGIDPISLEAYSHRPDNVLYIIGGDYGDIEFEKLSNRNVEYVTIKNQIDSTHLWSNVVAGIVLRDRYIKSL